MSEADLRAVNQIPNGMVIKAGSTLLVRRSAEVREDVAEAIADNAQLSLGRQATAGASHRACRARTIPSPSWRAATRSRPAAWPNGTSCAESAALKPGQRVTVYLPARSRAAAAAVRTASAPGPAGRSKQKPVKVARD